MGAEELMGFHRERGEAVAGALEQSGSGSVGRGDVCPEGLLLGGIQEQTGVNAARGPGGVDEEVPVLNVGGVPGFQTFGPTSAMESCGKGSGGTLAGRDHETALAQPRVELHCCHGSHSSVIRRRAGGMLCVGDMGRRALVCQEVRGFPPISQWDCEMDEALRHPGDIRREIEFGFYEMYRHLLIE